MIIVIFSYIGKYRRWSVYGRGYGYQSVFDKIRLNGNIRIVTRYWDITTLIKKPPIGRHFY